MPPRNPIEFIRRITGQQPQPCGDRVQIENANAQANSLSNPIYVVLVGDNAQEFITDEISETLSVIDIVHHEAHEGDLFSTGYISPHGSLVADNGNIDVAITTGALYCHLTAQGTFGGDFEGYMYEGATIQGDGTPLVVYNHKRVDGAATTVVAVHSPTVNNVGTGPLEGAFIPGGTGPVNSVGSTQGQRYEWILAPNTVYLFRLTNRAGSAQQGSLGLTWYETENN